MTDHTVTTWTAPDTGLWTHETAHFVGVTPVPMRDEFEVAYAEGFRRGFAPLGLPLSHVEVRHVNGWPYTSVVLHNAPRKAGPPPPALVLKVISRLHPAFRRRTKLAAAALAERLPQSLAGTWANERATWIAGHREYQAVDLTSLDDGALADHLERGARRTSEAWQRHFELVPGSIPLGEWLAHAARWRLDPVDARRAVMFGTPVHEEARHRLQRIARALGDARPADLDGVRSHSTEAAEALDDYLAHHGSWATENAVIATTVASHPDLVLRSIDAYRSDRPHPGDGADALVASLREQVPATDRDTFDRLVDDARRSHRMLDDNSGLLSSWSVGLLGSTLRHAADRLVQRTLIADPDDVWALSITEITGLLRGTSTLAAADVAARVSLHHEQAGLDAPRSLNGTPTPPPDPSAFPAPVEQLMTAVGAFLGDKFNDSRQPAGIGTEKVRGRAVVTQSASDAFDRLEPGDILVTTATTPSYNSVLVMVGGLVVSEGGPSCHAAVMARELGLSAVVGLHDAISTIPDGALVEIDPRRATVTVVG